jgi:hypothetical protein
MLILILRYLSLMHLILSMIQFMFVIISFIHGPIIIIPPPSQQRRTTSKVLRPHYHHHSISTAKLIVPSSVPTCNCISRTLYPKPNTRTRLPQPGILPWLVDATSGIGYDANDAKQKDDNIIYIAICATSSMSFMDGGDIILPPSHMSSSVSFKTIMVFVLC